MILVRRGVCLSPPMACVKLEPRANDAAVLPNSAGRRRLLVARRNPKADARPVLSLGAARKAPHVARPWLFRAETQPHGAYSYRPAGYSPWMSGVGISATTISIRDWVGRKI